MNICINKLIFPLGVVMFALIATSGVAQALSNSGDGSWQYYREINIQENSGNTLAYYQVMIELNNTNFPVEANISGADIRFTDELDNELSYWIESWDHTNNQSIIWVNVSSIPASGSAVIRMWYGNSLAESASNGDATFKFFDHFEGSGLDLGKWQQGAFGNSGLDILSYSNSVLQFRGSGCGGSISDWRYARTIDIWNSSEIALRAKTKRFNGISYIGFGYGGIRSSNASLFEINFNPVYGETRLDTHLVATNVGNTQSNEYFYDMTSETWYIVDLMKNGSVISAKINDPTGLMLNVSSLDISKAGDVFLYIGGVYDCITVRYYYDWIFVHNYVAIEPSVSVGPQQVIINGNFDTDLSGWIFEDASYVGCSVPYGDAIWDNGMARLGAHYAYGIAYLSQNFSDVRPSFFKLDYITNGGCGGISIYLNNGSETVFSFRALSDSLVSSNSRMMAQFMNETDIYCSSISCIESSGTLEVYFNNSSVDVYLNNIFLGNFNIAQNFSVDSIRLLSANSCCDGRNDNYGYFDNISLFGTYDVYNVYDVNPPASVTNLHNSSYASTYINWTWDNPSDTDFAKVKVYLNDVFQTDVTSPTNYFNATDLNPDTQYTISTQTVDTSGNINPTWVNDTEQTAPIPDTTPPGIITSLTNTSYEQTYIYWIWTNPVDSDFSYVEVYLDGSPQGTVPTPLNYFNATGLAADTSHEISLRTVDTSGNINQTWVNQTTRTKVTGNFSGNGTITVDDSGGAMYTTIQAAVNNASDEDVIQVAAGTYYEHVVVNKSVTLQGESNSTTIIDGNGIVNVVEVIVDGVIIDGFKIQNGSNGIYVTSSNNVFSNNSITNIVGANGVLDGAGGIGSGIYLSGSTNNTLTSNTISKITGGTGGTRYDTSGAGGIGSGIYLSGSTNNSLTSNTISNITGGIGGTGGGYVGSGGAGGIGSGIYLSGSTNNSLTFNTISNITGGPGGTGGIYGSGGADQVSYGVYLETDSYQNIISSTAMDDDPIIYYYGVNGIVIENYALTANSNPTNLGKIVLIDSSNTIIQNNIISNFTGVSGGTGYWDSGGTGGIGTGIYLSGSFNNTLTSNTISNITGGTGGTGAGYDGSGALGGAGGIGSGIYLSGSTNNTLTSNTISNITGGPGGTGGYLVSGGADQVSYGVYLETDSYQNIISSNTMDENPIIYYYGANGIVIENYVLAANSNPTNLGKIVLVNSSNTIIQNNIISNFTGVSGGPGGYLVSGGAGGIGSGIFLSGSTNNTLTSNTISNITGGPGGTGGFLGSGGTGGLGSGIYLSGSTNNTFTSNTISNITGGPGGPGGYDAPGDSPGGAGGFGSGIYLSGSTNNTFTSNTISNITGGTGGTGESDYPGGAGSLGTGIYLSGSTNNSLTSNTISNITGGTGGMGHAWGSGGAGGIGSGIYLSGSTNNLLTSNIINNIIGGIGGTRSYTNQGSSGADQVSYGIYIETDSYQNTISSTNTMDGDSIIYYYDVIGVVIENYVLAANSNPTNLGKIVLINSSNTIIKNNIISNITGGTNGTGDIFCSGGAGGFGSGIYLLGSTNNTLISNTISNITGGTGGTGGTMVYGMDSGGAGGIGSGIYLSGSTNNTLTSNTISNITGGPGGTGGLSGSGGAGGFGFGLYLLDSINNTLTSNTISNITGGTGGTGGYDSPDGADGIGYSIYLYTSNFNQLFHNNLQNADNNGYDDGSNLWDNGYSSGGNYWSDYNGIDANTDFIGDTPYNISGSAGAQDRYPLMQPCNDCSIDTTPPGSITNLNYTSGLTWINITWDNPSDADFGKVMVYLDGVLQGNIITPSNYYLATGLDPDTQYIVSTQTMDTNRNINQTWINHTAVTSIKAKTNDGVFLRLADSYKTSYENFYNTVGSAQGVSVSGNYAYIADTPIGYIFSGLFVVDISDPTNLTLAGSYSYNRYDPGPLYFTGPVKSVAVDGSYAYVTYTDEHGSNGLYVVNISDPKIPTLVCIYDFSGSALDVSVSDNHAYVADGANGLYVVNINDRTEPTLVGSYNTAGSAQGVSISGNYAYVADGANGLVVIDIIDPTKPTLTGSYNTAGSSLDVSVYDNYAYVADGANGLVVIDIIDLTKPTLAGSYNTAGSAQGVSVSGNYAYVADDANGLVVIDISDPTKPRLAGSYDTAGSALDVSISGNYIYIADDTNGLVVLDQPLELIIHYEGYSVLEYDVINFRAETLSLFNVSYEWDWDFNGVTFNSSGDTGKNQTHSWSTYGYYTVAVKGTDANNESKISTANITIYKQDPVPPVLSPIGNITLGILDNLTFNVSAFDWNNDTVTYSVMGLPDGAVFNNTTGKFTWTPNVSQFGNYTVKFTANTPDGLNDFESIKITVNKAPPIISAIPDQTFIINSEFIDAFNLNDYVSDLDTQKTDLTWTYSGNSVINVSISDDNNVSFTADIPYWIGEEIITFTATDPDGLNDSIDVNVIVLLNIALAGSYNTAGYARGVAVSGSYAYIADGDNGLVAVNISDPTNPTLIGSYNTAGYALGVAVSGSYAYVADYTNGLVAVNISDPTNPILVGSYNTAGNAWGVVISGSYAYVADVANGLVAVNISDPTNPTLIGSYNTAGNAWGVAVSGSYAYIADDDNGLVAVNISDPTNPTLIGSYNTAGYARSVAVSGSYAYIADDDNDLVAVNISDPTKPTLAGSYNTAGYALSVAVSGSYAYIADGYNGLVAVNISDPTKPTLAGSYNTAGYARSVAVSGSYAYVADNANGLVVLGGIPSIQSKVEPLPEYSSKTTFTVNYLINNPYNLGIENVSLYYNNGSGWSLYANNSTNVNGSFIFVASEDGYYEFYTIVTYTIPGREEEAPIVADAHVSIGTTPLYSITNINYTSGLIWINWTWDNPLDADFAKVMVYVNNIFQMNITSPTNHFNATGLDPDTQYIISTHTVDTAGNINQTWVNLTATTRTTGDFSGDGTTDAWDITYLARSITGIPGYETLSSGDVSGDGVVDAWDCTYLARAIAGVPGYNL